MQQIFWDFVLSPRTLVCFSPLLTYWGLAAFYSVTTETQGTLPRPAWHIVRAVLVQQALQVALTSLSMPADFDLLPDWSTPRLFVQSIARLALCAVIFDTWEYFMHRWMHVNAWLYRNVHSVHHELIDNRPYAALYNHPLEGFLMDTLGSVAAAVLSGATPVEFALFGTVATAKTVHDHVGGAPLRFDPFLLFPNNTNFHAVHHKAWGRKANFSQPFFCTWDMLCGTYMAPQDERPTHNGGDSSGSKVD